MKQVLTHSGADEMRSAHIGTERPKHVLIIGAGASGLIAAVCAARAGAEVTVLEHRSEAGIKLSITGNGRCNYTNTDIRPEHYHCSDPDFIRTVLGSFGYEDALRFFEELGIRPEIRHYGFDESGYVYPSGMNAAGFRDVIYQEAVRLGVKFCFEMPDAKVIEKGLNTLNDGLSSDNEGLSPDSGRPADAPSFHTKTDTALILAAGSNAYPSTGSDSSVYPLIRRLGLEFHSFLPALCGLYSKDPLLKEWKGRRVRGKVVLEILENPNDSGAGHENAGCTNADPVESNEAEGEIQFTEHSISGIPVMQVSRYAAIALKKGRSVRLTVCGRTAEESLSLSGGHTFDIHRTAGFDRSQVCSGGIDISEVDPSTMEVRRCPGVYVCGELLDVDGDCGGYNLHFAWATGRLAGISAAGSRL